MTCQEECQREDCKALRELLNRPEINNFIEGVRIEAAHQLRRWGREHDSTKSPEEWFWTVGYLAGKALAAQRADDDGKFMHHLISTAAVLANWHYFASNPEPRKGGQEMSETPMNKLRALCEKWKHKGVGIGMMTCALFGQPVAPKEAK